MRNHLRMTVLLGMTGLVPVLALQAQQPPDTARPAQPAATATTTTKAETPKAATDPIERIKEEGLHKSQVMATLSYLTDVIGPRLTGSPNMKRANEWTRDRLTAWGLSDAHLEPWGPFGRGWTLKRFSTQVIEPQCIPLIAFPKAWSPGTDGPLTARWSTSTPSPRPTSPEFKDKIKGAIVLTGPPRAVSAHFEPLATRKTDAELLELADAAEPAAAADAGARVSRQWPGPGQRQGRGSSPPTASPATPAAPGAAAAGAASGRGPFPDDSRADGPDASSPAGSSSSSRITGPRCSSSPAGSATAARCSSVRFDPRCPDAGHGRRRWWPRPGPGQRWGSGARASLSMIRTPPRSRPRSSLPRSTTTGWSG